MTNIEKVYLKDIIIYTDGGKKWFMEISYGQRKDRGSLEESLKTSRNISKSMFAWLLDKYIFYGYDSRCNQILWITKNNDYRWLFIQLKGDRKWLTLKNEQEKL